MEKVIKIGNSTAIITTSKDISGCVHDWSDEILTFHNREGEMPKKEFMALSDDEKEQLHVSGGCVACTLCGAAYWDIHNPHYL